MNDWIRESWLDLLALTEDWMRSPESGEFQMDITFFVPMEDEPIHTQEHPFCDDPFCPCHDDTELNQEHLLEPYQNGLISVVEGTRIYLGQQIR